MASKQINRTTKILIRGWKTVTFQEPKIITGGNEFYKQKNQP